MSGCAIHHDVMQAVDPTALRAALQRDDIDAALQARMLDWPACDACAEAAGLDAAAAQRLHQTQRALMTALAARERHRERNARLQMRALQRQRKAAASPALPPAAAAALARAQARAAAKREAD